MNAKTSIVLTLVVLGILRAGFAIIFDVPPVVWTIRIVIPSWFIAAGGVFVLAVLVFWLRANLYRTAPEIERAARWLSDDTAPLLADMLANPPQAYTGRTTRLNAVDADWYHQRESDRGGR